MVREVHPCPRSWRGSAGIIPEPALRLAGFLAAMLWGACTAAQQTAAYPSHAEVPVVNPSSSPAHLNVVGDTLLFSADDGVHGRELWTCDVDGHCTLAADIIPAEAGSQPTQLTNHGGWLYFVAATAKGERVLRTYEPGVGRERIVWGSAQSQETLHDVTFLGFADDKLYFAARTKTSGSELWVLRPGDLEATRLTDRSPGAAKAATMLPGGVLLFGFPGELWRTDGTIDGTRKVTGVDFETGVSNFAGLSDVSVFAGAERGTAGNYELWLTDGTAAGTMLLSEIRPGPLSSCIADLTPCGGAVYFKADDGEHGFELWRTDGTRAGTRMVRDINPGPASGDPHYFAVVGDRLYFLADDGEHGLEPWRTDGSLEGTVLVRDVYPGEKGSGAWSLSGFGDQLAFCANAPVWGEEVWLTDGTPGGTRLLKDIYPGSSASGPNNAGPNGLTEFNNKLFFSSDDGIHGEELWMTDGTSKGTVLAADISPVRHNPSSRPSQLTPLGQRLFFVVRDLAHGEEVWTSDGTTDGTDVVRDIAEGPADSAPRDLTPMGARLLFSAENTAWGRELWASDGTREGTACVRDIRAGTKGSQPQLLYAESERVFFTADDGVHGREVWRLLEARNGSSEDVGLVEDLTPGPEGTRVTRVFGFRGRVYFYVAAPDGSVALWRIGQEGNGARVVRHIAQPCEPWNPDLAPDDARHESEGSLSPLNSSSREPEDGLSPEDAYLIPALYPPSGEANKTGEPVSIGTAAFFVANTERYGAELWKTNGTIEGTALVVDAFPGRASSSPSHLTPLGNVLYFIADRPDQGRVLWRTGADFARASVVNPPVEMSRSELWGAVTPMGELVATPFGLVLSAQRPQGGTWGVGHLSVLWCDDGAPTHYDVDATLGGEQIGNPGQLTALGATVFFTLDDRVHGEELWAVDLSPPSMVCRMVKDIVVPGDLAPLRQ